MNKPKPTISIGLPAYNAEKYLQITLDSILSQSCEDFELIISDNASSDETRAICELYASRDRRIRYYRNEKNFGAIWNYNKVFRLATGGYFKWAAADDVLDPDFLKYCVEVMDNEPEVVLCYPKTILIDKNGEILKKYDDNLNLQASNAAIRFLQLFHSIRLCNPICGLIRSCALKKTRLLGEFAGSDNVLLAELCLLGKFTEIPYYMFFRRLHSESSSGLKISDNKFIRTKDMDKLMEFINPNITRKIALPERKFFSEFIISVKRAPINFREKVFILIYLFARFVHRFPYFYKEIKLDLTQFLTK